MTLFEIKILGRQLSFSNIIIITWLMHSFFIIRTSPGVFLFWTQLRLSLWMAMHLCMLCATPFEKGMLNMIQQNNCQEDYGCKVLILR